MEIKFVDGAAVALTQDNSVAVRQPHWPDGTDWGSEQEALDWMALFVESLSNPDSLLPGDSPDEPTKLRPLPEVTESPE